MTHLFVSSRVSFCDKMMIRRIVRDTVLFSSLFSAGEALAQRQKHKEINWDEMKKTVAWSIPSGVFVSSWYTWLDHSFKSTRLGAKLAQHGRWVPKMKTTSSLLIGKALLDVMMDAPLYGSYIWWQQGSNSDFWRTFGKMYATDLAFWIPANLTNFFLVSPAMRVPFYASAVFVWAVTLPLITKPTS